MTAGSTLEHQSDSGSSCSEGVPVQIGPTDEPQEQAISEFVTIPVTKFAFEFTMKSIADEAPPEAPLSKAFGVFIVLVFLFSSAIITVTMKWQNKMTVEVGAQWVNTTYNLTNTTDNTTYIDHVWERRPEYKGFRNPYIQAVTLAIGEMLALPVFYALLRYRQWRGEQLQEKVDYGDMAMPWHLYALLGLSQIPYSLLYANALIFTDAATFAMLKKSSLVFTVLISILWLGKRYQRFQWFALILVQAGFAILFLRPLLEPATTEGSKGDEHAVGWKVLGNAMVIVGSFFAALYATMSERIMRKWGVPPMQLIGCSSMYSGTFLIVLVAVMQAFKDTPDSFLDWAALMRSDWRPIFSTIIVTLCQFVFALSSTIVTKVSSGTHRKVIAVARVLIIWIFTLIIPVYDEQFAFTQLLGSIVLITGVFIFGKVIKLPCEFFAPDPNMDHKEQERQKQLPRTMSVATLH